jgi:hypothetical protein
MNKFLALALCSLLSVTASAGSKIIASVTVDGPESFSMYSTSGEVELSEVLSLCELVGDKLTSGWITLGGAIWDTETNTCVVTTNRLSTTPVNDAMLEQVESGELVKTL